MITRQEFLLIKSRCGNLNPYHQRLRSLSENAYRILAHDLPLLIAILEPLIKENELIKESELTKNGDSAVPQ